MKGERYGRKRERERGEGGGQNLPAGNSIDVVVDACPIGDQSTYNMYMNTYKRKHYIVRTCVCRTKKLTSPQSTLMPSKYTCIHMSRDVKTLRMENGHVCVRVCACVCVRACVRACHSNTYVS